MRYYYYYYLLIIIDMHRYITYPLCLILIKDHIMQEVFSLLLYFQQNLNHL
jgi:hypothetical protein